MTKINSLLKTESKAVSKFQSEFKSLLANAIRKYGLDKEKILAEITPKLEKMGSKYTKQFLQMGVKWLA
jgi:hypothetical protein